MSDVFTKMMSALFLEPEEYQERYMSPRKNLHSLPVPGAAAGYSETLPHMFISGGSAAVRSLLVNRLVENQRLLRRKVIVLQGVRENFRSDSVLNVADGSYDPLENARFSDACGLICDVAEALSVSPAPIYTSLSDELEYIMEQEGRLSMRSFLMRTAREIGADAFLQNRDSIAESHATPSCLQLDYLKNQLQRGCRLYQTAGRSLRSTAANGRAVAVKIPQNNIAWIGAVLSEVQELCAESAVMVIICGISIPASCQRALEQLDCGCCLCYPDLPAMEWLWRYATRAADSAMFLRHRGPSAEAVSQYFHQVEREKISRTTSKTKAYSDSGGFMGLFGSSSVANATGVEIIRQWEARFSADEISRMGEDEGIFVYEEQTGRCRVR